MGNPTIYRLPVLLREVAEGVLRVPIFQRPFEWRDEQRTLLLDSIKKGMPIGSFLIWRTEQHRLESYQHLGPFPLAIADEQKIFSYLLDGHQRLSTLYGALHQPEDFASDNESHFIEDETRWPIYYDLELEDFRLKPRSRKKIPPTWLPLPRIFNNIALINFQKPLVELGRSDLARRAEELAARFVDYQIPVIPIVTEDLKQAVESFRRVNSAGTRMGEVQMLRALLWDRNYDLTHQLRGIIEKHLAPFGWGELEPQDLLDTIKVLFRIDIYKESIEPLRKVVQDKRRLEQSATWIAQALKFLIERCTIQGPVLLPYKYQLACLAEAARCCHGVPAGDVGEKLERWFWLTTYAEYFGGMMDRGIRESVDHVSALVNGEAKVDPPDISKEISPLGRFSMSSARSRALVLLLLRQTPKDSNGCVIENIAEIVAGEGAEAVPKIVSASQLDNSALSEGPENRWIAPVSLRKRLEVALNKPMQADAEFLTSHLIPQEAAAEFRQGNYEGFLKIRRKAIQSAEALFIRKIGLKYVK